MPDPTAAEAPVDPVTERVRARLVDDLDAGFAELMTAYQGLVFSVASGLRRDRADAQDLTAEVFLRAYRALRTFDAQRLAELQPRAWLLTALRNTARNAARDASRRPVAASDAEPVDEPATGPSVEEQVERGVDQERLRTVLAQLPETQRTAVVLRHVGELTNSEVGDVLGCPEGTAKSHVSRGLTRLRSLLATQDLASAARAAAGSARSSVAAGGAFR